MKKLKFKINKEPKIKKPKTKEEKLKTAALVVGITAGAFVLCTLFGLIVVIFLLNGKPQVDINDFVSPESSKVYDKNGEVIAELGMTIRENVTYDELPNSLIDAFVAVEDSRFFEHNGFDVPRFTKALISNLASMSFGQGGSTFTMQLVKNTYFVDDEAGINAPKKLSRKAQEIADAMELETLTNKKTIMELYLNKLNFGGSRNIRGVEKAAEYYFGKKVTDLNLAESALLAGVINAPNAYNPFNNLELATDRRDTVLYLMKYHGYISDTDYELAKSIKVEDLLVKETTNTKTGTGIPYQAYIDAVANEVYQLTGNDAYSTTMDIYTYMDKDVQLLMDKIQEGRVEEFEYPDDEFEIASIAVNNSTGEIVGVLGGRNYAGGGALLLNHAIDQYKQPGSSIKPIIDYAPAFENLGWATSHVVVDKPIVYPGTSIIISNSSGEYNGQVTLKDALGNSLNTPAIQALQSVVEKIDTEGIVKYMNNMGFSQITVDNFNIQFAIGGGDITVSCKQMAAAQATLMNYGDYYEPHCISKIEFKNGKNPITPAYKSTEALSDAAAYLTAELLYSNVHGGYANLMSLLNTSYPTYAKTGTTDWGTSGVEYGIPVGAIKDSWMIASTPQFTVATWIGYEKAQSDKQSYITLTDYLKNIQGKSTKLILDQTVASYGDPGKYERPEDVVGITHILATYPYASTIEGMDEKYIANGYIAKKYYSLVDPQTATVEAMTGKPTVSLTGSGSLSITWPEYPDKSKLTGAGDTMDISLKKSDGSVILEATGKRLFDYSFVFGPIKYKASVTQNGNNVANIISDTNTYSGQLSINPGDKINVCAFYGYEHRDINSNQECQDLNVSDVARTFKVPATSLGVDAIKSTLESVGFTVIATEDSNIKEMTLTSDTGKPVSALSFDHEYTMNQSDINKTTLTLKYPKQTTNILITSNITSYKPGDTITVKVQGIPSGGDLTNCALNVTLGGSTITPTPTADGFTFVVPDGATADIIISCTYSKDSTTLTSNTLTITATPAN